MKANRRIFSTGQRLNGKAFGNPAPRPTQAPRPPIPTPPEPPRPGERKPKPATKPKKDSRKSLPKGRLLKFGERRKLIAKGAKGIMCIRVSGMRTGL